MLHHWLQPMNGLAGTKITWPLWPVPRAACPNTSCHQPVRRRRSTGLQPAAHSTDPGSLATAPGARRFSPCRLPARCPSLPGPRAACGSALYSRVPSRGLKVRAVIWVAGWAASFLDASQGRLHTVLVTTVCGVLGDEVLGSELMRMRVRASCTCGSAFCPKPVDRGPKPEASPHRCVDSGRGRRGVKSHVASSRPLSSLPPSQTKTQPDPA